MCQEIGVFGELAKRLVICWDVGGGLKFTNQPNCDTAPQENRTFIDRALNSRRRRREPRSVEVDGQEETGEDVVVRGAGTDIERSRKVD